MRLFLALDLPDEIKSLLGGIYYGLPGARWISDEQMHLTLCFIGEVDGSMMQDISEALGQIECQPFAMSIQGIGCFPPRGEPTVLWAGVDKNDDLLILQRKIENALRQVGAPFEKRKFIPHITLARLNNTPMTKLAEFFAQYSLLQSDPFDITEFHLFSSELTPKGSIYNIEESFGLED